MVRNIKSQLIGNLSLLINSLDMDQATDFTINDLAAKCKSKSEFYSMLATEGGLYLPPTQDSNQTYLRELLTGTKNYVKSEDVKVIKVPHYKGLTVSKILTFARSKGNIDSYLPDYKYDKEPNREWLWNVINSLIPKEFQEFILLNITKRKQEIIRSQNLNVLVKPEFMNIFKNSQSISTQKGKTHFLTRPPTLTKSQLMLKNIEKEKEKSDSKVEFLKTELLKLKDKIAIMEENQKEAADNEAKLAKLYDQGIINEDGDLISNDMN